MNHTIKNRIDQVNNGQVPEGYKTTEFGVFPIDWEMEKTFGDLFVFYGGLGKSREELGDKGIEYLHYGDMHRGEFNKVSYAQYSVLPKYEMRVNGNETYLMKDGDIAFLDASEDLEGTSRAVLIDNPENKPFIAGLHTFVAKDRSEALTKYYKQYITKPEFVYKQFRTMACGFKVYGLNRNTITRIQYAYPKNIEEQQRIAEILMTWDEAIELQEEYIEKLKLRKKALMQKLLTTQKGWSRFRLGDICKITTGKLDANAMVEDGEYPFFTCSKEVYLIDKFAYDYEALLIAGNGDIGDIKYYNGKFNAYQRTYILYDFSIPIKYVMYFLEKHFDKEVLKGMQKSSMPYIKIDLLTNANIYYDDKHLKYTISLLSLSDDEISLQKQKLEKLRTQRKALMQLLLTGIVRV